MAGERNGGRAYELRCTDCAFTTTFSGEIDALYDVLDSHQERMASSPDEHFVDFEATPSSGATGADD